MGIFVIVGGGGGGGGVVVSVIMSYILFLRYIYYNIEICTIFSEVISMCGCLFFYSIFFCVYISTFFVFHILFFRWFCGYTTNNTNKKW